MWSSIEIAKIQLILDDLSRFKRTSVAAVPTKCLITSSDAQRLAVGLSDKQGCLIIRRVLEHLGADEKLPFRWMLDHKLVQSLLLREFTPSLIPVTMGLAHAYTNAGDQDISTYLDSIFPDGFVIKATRNSGSQRQNVLASRELILPGLALNDVLGAYRGSPESELFLIQSKVVTVREYRVHTIGRHVVSPLTFRTFGAIGGSLSLLERQEIELFTKQTLECFPDGLCSDLVCGWDIGIDSQNRHYLFEINFTGNHPVLRPGFQCSGQLQAGEYSAINTARLLQFVSTSYDIEFVFEMGTVSSELEIAMAAQMYRVSRWMSLLSICADISKLCADSNEKSPIENASLRQLIYRNRANAVDRSYVGYLDWLKKMTDDLR